MVGVPDFTRWVCGPSVRTAWPIFFSASQRMTRGPAAKEISNAVIAASTVRSVM